MNQGLTGLGLLLGRHDYHLGYLRTSTQEPSHKYNHHLAGNILGLEFYYLEKLLSYLP